MTLCGLCFSMVEELERNPAVQALIASQSSNILTRVEGLMSRHLEAHTSNLAVIIDDMLLKNASNI